MGVLNAAIAAAYYLRVISTMYFTPPVTALAARGGLGTLVGTVVCCLLVIVLGLWPGIALRSAESADPLLQQSRSAVSAGLQRRTTLPSRRRRADRAGQLQKGGSLSMARARSRENALGKLLEPRLARCTSSMNSVRSSTATRRAGSCWDWTATS